MTNSERLEEIKERFAKYEYDYNLNGEDVEWLIRRVQELERKIERYREALETMRNMFPMRGGTSYDKLSRIRKIAEKALVVEKHD